MPLPAVAVAVAGLLLTVVAFFYIRHAEERIAWADFSRNASAQTAFIEQGVDRTAEAAYNLANLVRASPDMSRESFQRHAALALERHPGFYSVAWSEWIPHDRRSEVVQLIRNDGVQISDLFAVNDNAEVTLAAESSHYLVMRYFYSAEGARHFIGSNILARPMRLETVARAAETGEVAATGPVRLAADPQGVPSALVFVPVYDAATTPATVAERRALLRGTISIGVRIQAALESWLGSEWPADLCTVIIDNGDPGRNAPLFRGSAGPWESTCKSGTGGGRTRVFDQRIDFAGRPWHVIHTPTPAVSARVNRDPAQWVALILGTLLSLSSAALVALYIRHHQTTARYAAERTEAAKALDQVNQNLLRANSEMEQIVSAVSHDLKNGLLAMEWSSRSVATGVRAGDAGAVERGLSALQTSLSMVQRLIDDLLEHSHVGSSPFAGRWFESGALVREVSLTHAADAERLGADLVIEGEMPRIYGDYNRLFAAFDNLIGNALRYGRPAEPDVPMRIAVGVAAPSNGVADEANSAGADGWLFYVRDNGCGIPHEAADEIFQMFSRLDTKSEGTGIGLAIVKRVAEVHQGSVYVEDSPGGGATFWLKIPRLTDDEAPESA